MISRSEKRKYLLRWLTMSSRRARGGALGVSSTTGLAGGSSASTSSSTSSASSSLAGVSSDRADTVDPHQRRVPEPAAAHDDREQVVSDHDRGDEAGHDADAKGEREALDRQSTR